MKIFIFLILFPCTFLSAVPFNFAEYKFSSSFTDEKVSAYTGLRLNFPHLDLRSYVTLPATEYSVISDASSLQEYHALLNDLRWGAGVNAGGFTVKGGMNVYSASLSKLKNPSPSTSAYPLTKSSGITTGLKASLPALTSSVQDLSLYAAWTASSGNTFLSSEAAFFETGNLAANLTALTDFSKYVSLKNSITVASFEISNTSYALRQAGASFTDRQCTAVLFESFFRTPPLRIALQEGIYQSPYGGRGCTPVNMWIKASPSIYYGNFLINFSFFILPFSDRQPAAAPLTGLSSNICRTLEQYSVNPQFIISLDRKGTQSIRLGLHAIETFRTTATKTPVTLRTAKIRAGATYSSKVFDSVIDYYLSDILLEGTPPNKSSTPEKTHSFTLTSTLKTSLLKTELKLNYKNCPPVTSGSVLKESFSAYLKTSFPVSGLTARAGAAVNYRSGKFYSGTVTAEASYTLRRKYFRTTLKAALSLPL